MRSVVTTALEVSGLALVSVGVAAIFWPAGVIVAGLSLVLVGWRAA